MIRQRSARDWAGGVSPRPAFENLAFLLGEGDLNGRSSATPAMAGSSFRGSTSWNALGSAAEIPDSGLILHLITLTRH